MGFCDSLNVMCRAQVAHDYKKTEEHYDGFNQGHGGHDKKDRS